MSFLSRARERFEQLLKPKTSEEGKAKANQSNSTFHNVLQSEFVVSTPPSTPKGSAKSRGTSPPGSTKSDDGASTSGASPARAPPTVHESMIVTTLTEDVIDLEKLRKLCWSGCPNEFRAECWGVLTGYYPLTHANRVDFLRRKRAEYGSYVSTMYSTVDWNKVLAEGDSGVAMVGSEEIANMKQIRKDVPRVGTMKVLLCNKIQGIMERVLFIWSVRHPACGYVQGMNDLLTPFLFVLLVDQVVACNGRVSYFSGFKTVEECEEAIASIKEEDWAVLEADLYWNLSRVLARLQENYTFNQRGCHEMVKKLEGLMKVIDPTLCKHLEYVGVTFPEFAFRWMNCLLLREISAHQALRLWDTYLCEEDISCFHVFVCCELLIRWSDHLKRLDDLAAVISFLQTPPTFHFLDRDLDEITSSAFLLQQRYDKSFKHLLDQ
jgi:hypothetical protein